MSLTAVGTVFLILAALTVARPRAYTTVLAMSAVFPTTAGVVVGGESLPVFVPLAAIATLVSVTRWLTGTRVRHSALRYAGLFALVTAMITLLAPTFFSGTPVLDPRGGIDAQVFSPTPLAYTASMGVQVVYLALGIGVVLYIAQQERVPVGFLTPGMVLGSVLSAARLAPESGPLMDPLFRNLAQIDYTAYSRHYGVFAEPSYLAVFSMTALGYALFRWADASRLERSALLATIACSLANVLAAVSGTAVLALILLVAFGAAWLLGGFVFGGRRLSPWTLLGISGLVAIALFPNPLARAIAATISDKAGSASFANRIASDGFSLDLAMSTYGFGVGLGASRPSGFFSMLLSNTGVVGVSLFIALVASAIVRARNAPEWRPYVVALICLLTAKIVAEPALSTPLLWILLGAVVRAGVVDTANSETIPVPAWQREAGLTPAPRQ